MPPHTPSPAELAKERLRARAERISRLRRRVAAVALATFAVAFGAIAFDGSMGTTGSSPASQQAAVRSSATSSDDSSSSDDTSTSSATSPMTTQQS